ncbi:hypothetical protein PV963_01955 [Streptomyces coeruleorubidus]|uniref:hypothetical protein n=1 Tax=Streptomyces coeruleorubidus TaxID=116188 RepID=UPI00237F43FD|nr:hypothetical protein [Streptomyces coeruleorubidus]WDV57069.1 hypothetical protein PV963_01955 [Streptomyces coeruleorubidus]
MSDHAAVELSPEAIAFADFMAGLVIPESEVDAMRTRVESVHLTAREPEGVTYREVDAGGVLGIWCEPVDANTDYVLLHGHAGGSVLSSAFVDRELAGHIAKAAGPRTGPGFPASTGTQVPGSGGRRGDGLQLAALRRV